MVRDLEGSILYDVNVIDGERISEISKNGRAYCSSMQQQYGQICFEFSIETQCFPQYEWITSCEWFWAGGNYIGSGGSSGSSGIGSSGSGAGSNTVGAGVGVYNPEFADEDISDLLAEIEANKADDWEDKIDADKLNPCMKDELASLKSMSSGLGEFIQSLGNSSFFKWKLKDKSISDDGSGQTTYGYTEINLNKDGATSYFDYTKLTNATDIGIAALILHEGMHAYLHYKYRDQNISKSYVDLFEKFYSEKAEHEMWVKGDFIVKMATTLKEYGDSKGYSYALDYYKTIAWGGLKDTDVYNNDKTTQEKENIDNVVKIELSGKDSNGISKSQKGTDGGC